MKLANIMETRLNAMHSEAVMANIKIPVELSAPSRVSWIETAAIPLNANPDNKAASVPILLSLSCNLPMLI